jgi:hypothetical protein
LLIVSAKVAVWALVNLALMQRGEIARTNRNTVVALKLNSFMVFYSIKYNIRL